MAEQKLNLPIPQQSLVYLGLCLTGVLIFALGGIAPAYRSLVELEAKEVTLKQRIEEQRILQSLYKNLQNARGQKDSTVLPLTEKGVLTQAEIDTLPLRLNSVAKANGMTVVSAIPNVSALTGNARFLSVNLILKGNFRNFRKFLINLGGIPYVEHIEEIIIQSKPDAKEYRLKFWVTIS